MSITAYLSYFFEGIVVAAGIAMLVTRNVLHAALMAICVLLSVAAIFFLSGAEFLGVTQILVYAGGILVIVLFGIMLTVRIAGKSLAVENQYLLGASALGLLLFGVLATYYVGAGLGAISGSPEVRDHTVSPVGMLIMTDYLLPFELAGLLLLVALVGAAMITALIKDQKAS